MNKSPDLDSILNDQYHRLQGKELRVQSKIRASKHTSKYLSSYIEKRNEIEAKYISEIANLCNTYAPKLDESHNISKVWMELLENDKLQCEQRRRYISNLGKEEQLFTDSYLEHKSAENRLSKEIETNRKILCNSQKKLDDIMSNIENVKNELKKMDEKRRNEERDRFNDKELKRFKDLRIKLAHLESMKMEKSSNHDKTKTQQSEAMEKNMKIFLKQQIHHLNAIKRSLFNLEKYQSELHINCDQINKQKLNTISDINPVEDLLDWISSNCNQLNDSAHNTPTAPKHSERPTQSESPWSKMSIHEDSLSSIQDKHRPRSASVGFISTSSWTKDKDLLHSALINDYWKHAFPQYAVQTSPSLSTLEESPIKKVFYSRTQRENDIERLLLETAHDIKDFKSSYSIKSGYNVYCEMDQLFPCNISYKKLDTFYLKHSEWNKLYFEFLVLSSNYFRNVSPHVNHLWHLIIPQTLNLSRVEVKQLIDCMEPIDKNKMNMNHMTLLDHYLWLISYKTRFEFDNDEKYGLWLRRQMTIIVASIAWKMTQHHDKSQWKLYKNKNIIMSYVEIISYLNAQSGKIVTFVVKYPCNQPSDHKELQSFIQTIDYLVEQMSEYKDIFLTPNLNKTQSISAGLNASEEDFESQSEIEYLSDEDDDDKNKDDENETKQEHKTPSKQNEDARYTRHNVAFPKQISRFILWQLMNILIIETQDDSLANQNRKSIDLLTCKFNIEEEEINDISSNETKLMMHSKILSDKTNSEHIDYDDLNIIPGTAEAQKSEIVGEYKKFLESFEDAYCDLLQLNPYIVFVLMARLTINVCLDHIDFDCDGISLLESLISIPIKSSLSTTSVSSSPHIITTTTTTTMDDDDADDALNYIKPKRSTKYHINKKWDKLKKKISISSHAKEDKNKKKKKKFRPKKLARRLSINLTKQNNNNNNQQKEEEEICLFHNNCDESMKDILRNMWFNIYECIKENNLSNISNVEDDDAIVSHRIIKWILGHLQNWLFSYQSYPISITKDYFHLFIAGQSLISSSISDSVHCIEYILVAATHIKYDAIYDSIVDMRFKKIRAPKASAITMDEQQIFNVKEWQMFVEALVNWMDLESNNNQNVFEQYHIHPKIGQFILFTLCQRFSKDFKHFIFNTDPFELRKIKNNKQLALLTNNDIHKDIEIITNFMLDSKLIKLCNISRHFENNMVLNKNLLFPPIACIAAKNTLYQKISPCSNYIAVSQLGELVESQSNKLLKWTQSLLLKEDWIGIDEKQPFSQSVIYLFNTLNMFTDNFFSATRKLQIRTILSNDNDNDIDNFKWNVSKLRDSFIGIIALCINNYSDYILSISGKIKDVIPESIDIMELNAKNLQKCDNFNLKEIYRKSKKSLLSNINSNNTQTFAQNANNQRYLLYEQKADILCTRFESIQKTMLLCKSLNDKIKTIWFQTSNTNTKNDKTYAWLLESIDNLCKAMDSLANLISFYIIFVEFRVDIVDNLYSSNNCDKMVENAISLNLWNKMGLFFDKTICKNTSMDGVNTIVAKTLAVYLLSCRWIIFHSTKNRKFDVKNHRVIQCDMIPLIKFFAKYISNERIAEIRLLSTMDNIIDLMSKSTDILIHCCARSIIQFEKPFANISNNSNNYLFHPSNYKNVLSLFPYIITNEKDFIIHILVRRIQKSAQKFVAQQLQIINTEHAHNNKTNSDTVLTQPN